MSRAAEIRLETRNGRLAGLAWRHADGPRVLALHGWLDNAASFSPLAELLDRLDLVALDLPGHGHSEHRPAAARYHFIDYAFDADAALDALDWPDCHLLGHSMGASVAATYAAGAPERVRSLVLLDGLGPLATPAAKTTERLQRSLRKNRQVGKEPRLFDSLEEMIDARRSAADLSRDAARLICERGARPQGQRFTWRSDPALNWVSSLGITEEQILDLLAHIRCPVLTYRALPGSNWFLREDIKARKAILAHGQHLEIEGHHHFHMDSPAVIADTIESFFLRHDTPPKPDPSHA